MRNIRLFVALAILSIASVGCVGCENIDPGNVGILVKRTGDARGVQTETLNVGWHIEGVGESIYEYPVYVQTAKWERSGGDAGEQICFNSREGLVMCADISLSFQLTAEKVPQFYTTFRNDNVEAFTHGFLRNVTKDAFDAAAGEFTAEQILGEKKEALIAAVRERITAATKAIGVEMQQLGFLNPPRPPEQVSKAISARVESMQRIAQAQGEKAAAVAEADKVAASAEGARRSRVAQAQGEAEATTLRARAEAESITLRAEAQAKANKLIAASLTSELVDLERVQKWNGELPTYDMTGKGGALLQLPGKP